MTTKYDEIVKKLPRAEVRGEDGTRIAYIDIEGSIHTNIFGIKIQDFKRFAEWIAELASEVPEEETR